MRSRFSFDIIVERKRTQKAQIAAAVLSPFMFLNSIRCGWRQILMSQNMFSLRRGQLEVAAIGEQAASGRKNNRNISRVENWTAVLRVVRKFHGLACDGGGDRVTQQSA